MVPVQGLFAARVTAVRVAGDWTCVPVRRKVFTPPSVDATCSVPEKLPRLAEVATPAVTGRRQSVVESELSVQFAEPSVKLVEPLLSV